MRQCREGRKRAGYEGNTGDVEAPLPLQKKKNLKWGKAVTSIFHPVTLSMYEVL